MRIRGRAPLALILPCLLALGAALPATASAVDTAAPLIRIDRISSASPCVHVSGTNSAWVRSRGCSGSFDVAAVAFDPGTGFEDGGVSGLGTGSTASTYGIFWPQNPSSFDTAGTANWGNTARYEPGAPRGLDVDCWGNDSFSGTAATGIDPRLDYDAATRGTAQGFRNLHVTSVGTAPRLAVPGTGDLSCRWTGFVTPRAGAGAYGFKMLSDDHARVDLGSGVDAPFTAATDCTAPGSILCNWTNHAPTVNGPESVDFASASDARPLTFTWRDRGGQAAAALMWDPPGAPTLAPSGSTTGSITSHPGYEVVPAGNLVTKVRYARTYSFTADDADPASSNWTGQLNARDGGGRVASASFAIALDNTAPEPAAAFGVATAPEWTGGVPVDDPSVVVSKRDAGDAGSGVASIRLERRFAPWNRTTDACGVPGAPAVVDAGFTYNAGATQTATVQLTEGCYYFEYVVTDRVGGVTRNPMRVASTGDDPRTWLVVSDDTIAAPDGGGGTSGGDDGEGGASGGGHGGGGTTGGSGSGGGEGGGTTGGQGEGGDPTPPPAGGGEPNPPTGGGDPTPPPAGGGDTTGGDDDPDRDPQEEEPESEAPTVVLKAISLVWPTRAQVQLSWRGTDPQRDALTYVVQQQYSGWGTTPNDRWTTRTGGQLRVTTAKVAPPAEGQVGCFRVIAVDTAGNRSEPSAPRCTVAPLDDRGISAGGGWERLASGAAWHRTVTASTRAGATLTLRAAGSRIEFLLPQCSKCGRVELLVDGKVVAKATTRGSGVRTLKAKLPGADDVAVVTLRAVDDAPVRLDQVTMRR